MMHVMGVRVNITCVNKQCTVCRSRTCTQVRRTPGSMCVDAPFAIPVKMSSKMEGVVACKESSKRWKLHTWVHGSCGIVALLWSLAT